MLKILSVIKGGIADEIGLKCGDNIIAFNGKKADILDYIYYDAAENFTLTVKSGDTVTEYDIEKGESELMGLEFDNSAQIKPMPCRNKCIFCFVDQLPKKLRKSLYVKDDDYRLSFITGNYITLTNINKDDIIRITERKFSPLYISVHATDPQIRIKMLGNKNAGNIMELIKKFSIANITMHTQVVLCPGINDGEILKSTIKDLYSFYPAVKSLAVVPAGLTKHRQNLSEVNPVTKQDAKNAIEICNQYPQFAYCSDELYLRGEEELPDYLFYGEFEQIENGVGLIRKFEKEFYTALNECDILPKKSDITVITGKSAYKFINSLALAFTAKFKNINIKTISIQNNFFGESVTVAGLVTGTDIASQLGESEQGRKIIIPKSMLREGETLFLDGTDIITLEKQLKADIYVCNVTGYNFFDALTGEL